MKTTALLIVLDGWGIGRNDESNPIYVGKPKTLARFAAEYPLTSLQASGIAVGLPWGEVGNSEVGHLTLGAGTTIYQYYPKITLAIRDGSFFENAALRQAFAHARAKGSSVHFAGLLTDANVHASLDHLKALLEMAAKEGIADPKIHLWTDGKDSAPKSAEKLLSALPMARVATLVGRYYAMDRNQNWRLTEVAYRAMTEPGAAADPLAALKTTYAKGLTEEYLPPVCVRSDGAVKDGDALIFFNFREDSVRQIAEAFALKEFKGFARKPLPNLFAATMTPYERALGAPAAFAPDTVQNPFGKVLAAQGKNQLRIAETYKYAHVTYFFNGYREEPFENEYRVLIPSLSTPRPEDHPEMRATAITDRVLEAIGNHAFDFVLANYANPDTMGHTANYEAARKAVEVVDEELGRIAGALTPDTLLVVTSDHGHIEEMIDPATGVARSQHNPSPVPLYLVADRFKGRKFANAANLALETMGTLADVAPTLLELMGIPQPPEMTGKSLLEGIV